MFGENIDIFIYLFSEMLFSIQVSHSNLWLSKNEDGHCLKSVQRTLIVNNVPKCTLSCLMGATACYGVSFNSVTGECKISNTDMVEPCSAANLKVYTSSETAPTTTTTTATTTPNTVSATTSPLWRSNWTTEHYISISGIRTYCIKSAKPICYCLE